MSDSLLQARQADWEASCALFSTLPGADSLIARYGRVPSFHDGEVDAVHLSRKGQSEVRIRIGWPDHFAPDQMVVSLAIANVLDIELDGFSPQNVIGELWLRQPVPSMRYSMAGFNLLPGDIEINLESIYGIGGTILCRGIEVHWRKLRPSARRGK